MISGTATTHSNELLTALSHGERERFLKRCEQVTLEQDEILAQPFERIRHVYFPLDCFISLLTGVAEHDALGVGMVGSEGMLGTSLVLGVNTSPLRARVDGPGGALRMTASDFQRTLVETPRLERLLRRYVHGLLAQIAQTVACAAFHVVDLRLAYWLLMAHDRAHGNRLYMTHALLARILGVRRSGVTTVAGALQRKKIIRYTRGHIAILDRKALEQAACGCYPAVREVARQIAVLADHHDELDLLRGEETDANGHPHAPRHRREDDARLRGPGTITH